MAAADGAVISRPSPELRGSSDRAPDGTSYDAASPSASWRTATYSIESFSAIMAANPRTAVGLVTAIAFSRTGIAGLARESAGLALSLDSLQSVCQTRPVDAPRAAAADASLPTAEARLRAAGLRVTAQRLAILAALDATRSHPHVTWLVEETRRRLGAVSTQAVYDALASLTAAGLVRRIEPAGSPARFEARTGDNHHHVVCRRCGAAADVDCVVGAAPCLEPSASAGFAIDEAEITFWGLCPTCQHAT